MAIFWNPKLIRFCVIAGVVCLLSEGVSFTADILFIVLAVLIIIKILTHERL